MKKKNLSAQYGTIIIWTLFLVFWIVISVVNNCGVYADGSYTVLKILESESLWLWYPARRVPMLLTRIFIMMLLKLKIYDFYILIKAYSFGCTFWTALFVWIASYIAYKKETRFFELNICLWGLIIPYTGLYCMHESLLTVAICWLQFIIVYFYDQIKSRFVKIFILGLSLVTILGTHESYAILGSTLLIACIIKYLKMNRKCDCIFYIFIVSVLLSVLQEIYGIVNSNETSRDGFLTSIQHVDRATLFFFTVLITYVIFFSIVKFPNALIPKCTEVLLVFYIVFFMLHDVNTIVHDTRLIRSLLHVIIPCGMIILMSLIVLFVGGVYNDIASLISKGIIVAATGTIILISNGYSNYLKNINNELQNSKGFIEWTKDDSEQVYNTDWTIPFESIIANKIYGGDNEITSIAVQPLDEIYYQPFNMWNIDEYFDLTKFGIIYNKIYF